MLIKNYINKLKLFILRSAIVFNENNIINNITRFIKYVTGKYPVPVTNKNIFKPIISYPHY